MALSKIFTTRFYAKNTGFFLVIFYFFFGIVPGGQLPSYHYTLIKGFTGSPGFLALVCLLWLLYNLKCIAFIINVLSTKEHSFLYGTLGILEGSARWRTWLWIHLTLYAPVLIYSLISAVVAAKLGFHLATSVIVLFSVLMLLVPLWIYLNKMKHPGTVSVLSRWQQWFNRTVRKHIWSFYGHELLNNNMRSLGMAKIAAAVIVIITCSLMADKYDERVLLVGILICVLAQSVLVYNHRRFDDLYLSMLPQLPVPLWKRYLQMGGLYLALVAPESVLLIYKTWQQANPIHWVMLITSSLSMLMLFRSILYFPRIDQDKYFRWVLIIVVTILFMGLARLYWYGIVGMQAVAGIIFYNRYYRYEAPLEKVD
ncbi:hypothetical protein [Chitinophaga pinensis]|uniref:Uncharacterized protein n=1 Tax=Chitinophaga pinensis (strain ATCC 43595 / DSM 2588 / LMG 13176 / NBRC 15968 / NCIMB 11800 / UQM 2034) TaxID=485918 RepID=A0A979G2K2_CHIPD|nr:hypothetical protein [Chitinophaga pinensis]ACU59473.1 hypothetical protein Cpin_1977 [Chitinophaga pinensis DSM 2588]